LALGALSGREFSVLESGIFVFEMSALISLFLKKNAVIPGGYEKDKVSFIFSPLSSLCKNYLHFRK